MLSKESAFSSFGWNSGGLNRWFKTDETLGRIKELFPTLATCTCEPLFTPGYLFIRKGEVSRKMYEDCLCIADAILNDELLSQYGSMTCAGRLRDDPIFTVAMSINGLICHAKPSMAKCISLPSKYKIDRIDILGGSLDVTDKKGKEFNDCSLLHFSTRKAEEEGLYLWQKTVVDLHYKKSKLAKVLNKRVFLFPFFVYRRAIKLIKTYLLK